MDNNNEKLKVFIDAVNDEIEAKLTRIIQELKKPKNALIAGHQV